MLEWLSHIAVLFAALGVYIGMIYFVPFVCGKITSKIKK